MTTLMERDEQTLTLHPEHDQRLETFRRRNRMLTILVILMAAVLVAMAAWIVVDATRTSDVAPTAEIEQLLDDYRAAWNDYDGEAFLGMTAPGYRFEAEGFRNTAEEQASVIDGLGTYNWQVATRGEVIVAGDGPWYTAEVNVITGRYAASEGSEGITLKRIVDNDGTLKVSKHIFLGQR